jgi:hypothetical protein
MVIAEVPSFEYDRLHGESNLRTFRDGWRVLVTILRERFSGKLPTNAQVVMPPADAPTVTTLPARANSAA